MQGAFYDIENYPNFFCVTFLNVKTNQDVIDTYIKADITSNYVNTTSSKEEALSNIDYKYFEISDRCNDIVELIKFLKDIKLLIGFNNRHYDNLLIDYICIHSNRYLKDHSTTKSSWLICQDLNALGTDIIRNNNINYKYYDKDLREFEEWYSSIDLLEALFETIERKGLKQVAINLKWYRIEDLPIKVGSILSNLDMEKVKDYNFNDVLITRAFKVHKQGEIDLKIDLSAKYELNLRSSNRSSIADKILSKYYSQYTGQKFYQYKDKRTIRSKVKFGDIIDSSISFKDAKLQSFLNTLKNKVINVSSDNKEDNSFSEILTHGSLIYQLGVGGLHSKDSPKLFDMTDSRWDGYILRDADVKTIAS